MLISFVIPAKNEFPQVIWTVHSIIEAMPLEHDYEIILVNDASTDKTGSYWGQSPHGFRGLVARDKMKIINVPSELKTVGGTTGVGCWRARTLGFQEVKGEITIFADSHIIVHGDTIARMVNLLQSPEINLLHTPVATLGDDPANPNRGYAYKLCLQRKFWGEYTNRNLKDEPYTVAMGGFAFCGGRTKFLRELGLWHEGFQGSYSGGEQYIDLKVWMLGGKVWIDPNSLILHSSISRGYCFTNECMWHNTLAACYCIAGEEWMQMVYRNMEIEKYKAVNFDLIRKLCELDREDILKRQKYKSFDEILQVNPWMFPIKGSRFTNIDNESLPDLV
jgi:glycosyltransferase involved in cell wall biosynthesis